MEKKLYDLTNPQKSIYYTEEYYKDTNINNIGGPITIFQPIDFDKLILAIKQTIKQNDGCRIMLSNNNKKISQYVSNYKDFSIEIVDVASEIELNMLTRKVISNPLFTYNSYLFKFVVFRFPDNHGGFIINMHHIISDSWTLGIVINEIIDNYSICLKNENFTQKDTTLYSYTNYILAEQNYKLSNKYSKDKAYWGTVFSTIPNIATIPCTNCDTISNSSLKALREEISIPSDLLNNIKEYCNRKNISLFNFFTGIFSVYISKVSNLEDFCIGTPILNRSNYKEKNTVGMFINTLPIRININNSLSFEEFLNSLSKNTMSLLRHQKYSYQNIIEDLRKKQNNLFGLYNIMISYQITKMNSSQDDIPHKTSWCFNNTMKDDIDIHIFDLNDTGELNIAYDYKVDKYSSQDMKKIHNRILELIFQVLNNENIKISDFEIVTPDEKNQLINNFNKTNFDYPKNKTISELFEEQVKLTPNNTALVFENKSLTFKELNEKANSLAYFLRKKQIKNNCIVGIMVNRSLEMIVGILGVLKSGGAYIPIDPDYPSQRIDYILENSNTTIVLTSPKLLDKININCEKIDISLSNKDIYNLPKENLTQISKPNDLSYLIYTSGSTGKPKGVMLTQKALVNLTYYCNDAIPYLKNREYISIVSVTSVSFDIFIFETLISLQRGIKLVIANSNEQNIPNSLNSLIEKENIQAIQTTPSRMQLFYQHINDIPNLCNLKYITLAGEPLSIVLKNNLLKLTHGKIFNGYGPSETTVFSTLTDVTNKQEITIGKPLANTQIYILDNNLKPCPIGVAGEIYIAGDGVSLGYMKNPILTKRSFIPNPFKKDTIMYKTGDLGLFKKNGEIICLGRVDFQIKMRGLRIELEEIENVMLEFKPINNCVVAKKVSNENHEFLCAYYTSYETIFENDLKAILRKKLPNYMIPKYFVKLDSLPYTPNGKIDKNKLPLPLFNLNNKEIIKPKTTIELEICEIVKNIVSHKKISIKDNFFDDLNFDSLNTMELSSYLYKYDVSIQDINDYPTIEELANKIEKHLKFSHFENTLPKIDIKNEHFDFDLTNILLTGSLGFLGIHILKELLLCEKVNTIYLLIRNKPNLGYKERFNKTLNYYFKDNLENEVKKKVKLISGDFESDNLGVEDNEYKKLTKKISTVIHCGANVKHYGKFKNFIDANVKGTQNIIDFCEESNAKLAHISTISIGGYESDINRMLTENTFNINQVFNNHVYMISKYLAEYHVLLAINNDKIKAKIFRLGNIMPRYVDNIFQLNAKDNAMFSRLKTITKLGKITDTYENLEVDFSPVDLCANAITTILQNPSEQTIYHIYNNNKISLMKFFKLAKINLAHTEQNDFTEQIQNMKTPFASYLLDDIQNSNTHLTPAKNDLTTSLLKKEGFFWNNIDTNYINKLVEFI